MAFHLPLAGAANQYQNFLILVLLDEK